jgi:hypothetical protein
MIRELAMKTLQQEIKDMRAHVKDLTATERALVMALGDELRRSDEDLLHAIRTVAADHEERRRVIMSGLQALAASAGLLPRPLTASGAAIASGSQRHDSPALNHYRQHAPGRLEEEVSYHLNRRMH